MNLLRRFIPMLVSMLHAGMFLFLLFKPQWLLRLLPASRISMALVMVFVVLSLLSLLASLYIVGHGYGMMSRLRFYPFLAISTASAFTVFMYSDYRPVLWGVGAVVPAYIWLWTESLYLFWQQPALYQPYTLQRLASYLYLLELFLFVAAAAGVQVLFQVPVWIVLPACALVYWVIQYDLLSICRIERPYAVKVAFVGTILAVQLQLVLNALPTHFLLYAGMMTLFFYAWIGLSRLSANQEPVLRSQVLPYAVVSAVGAITTFFTSLWIT